MKIALIQQECTDDKSQNLRRGLEPARKAVNVGAKIICFPELSLSLFIRNSIIHPNPNKKSKAFQEQSHAKKLFLKDHRPELYADWITNR